MAALIAPTLLLSPLPSAHAKDLELNLYSARHYSSDQELYDAFTKQTGIKINQIQAGDEALLERIKSEGKASPADVILLADAARLWKAQHEGLFQPVQSAILRNSVPAAFQSETLWFGFTTRARIIVFDKSKISPEQIRLYDDLANPALKGKVCTRSGTHPYMLSLLASIIAHQGEQKAEAWARGVVANLARTPRGGDTDQIKGVISGECAVALTNSYYLVRLLKSPKAEEREAAAKLGVIWPNQGSTGTHINVSGGGVARYAPNPDSAKKFLEFLASPAAQAQFANANNEWPVVAKVAINNPELHGLGTFKAEKLSVAAIGQHQPTAARIIDRSGWK
ncbi:MAG: extracellular solute-binding protein [Burkholderiaceae bacterium]|nr:extracellular solute-binding protein [Burkholderiaceae bacterium]